MPFTTLLKEGDFTTFKALPEIRDQFQDAGLIFGSRAILSCGSGVSAAVLCFGLHLLGKDVDSYAPIYDGSWTEWASRGDLPRICPADDEKEAKK